MTAGVYLFQQIGEDDRSLELLPDSRIGLGARDTERRWLLRTIHGTTCLSIVGQHGETCRLNADSDGAWKGHLRHDRCPVKLVPLVKNYHALPVAHVPVQAKPVARIQRPVRVVTTDRQHTARYRRPSFDMASIAGMYTYRRVYHEDRPMDLLPDGTIGEGSGGAEKRWTCHGSSLELSGDHGVICRLKVDGDGVWRGNWTQFDRMPIELYPPGAVVPKMPREWLKFHYPETPRFWWSNYECLGQAVRKLCRQLPALRAVAGIPRSGLIPASLIAQWQNIPLLDIDDALVSRPWIPTYRRRAAHEVDEKLPILIVDDTVSSGRTLGWYKSRALRKGPYLFAAPYVDRRCWNIVDFFSEDHPQCFGVFEWNLLHESGHTQYTLCDLDGVICEEWTGGNEEQVPEAYQHHLMFAKPLRLPTKPLQGVVTGRMEIYHRETVAWLRKHGVTFDQLWMLPASTELEREAIGPARFKAHVYADAVNKAGSPAGLFVESCPNQAREIHRLTGKPVIDFTNMIAHGATLVR